MHVDPRVRDEPLYATPLPPPPLPLPSRRVAKCTAGSTDPTGPRGVWAGQWHVGVAITNCLPKERGRVRDECV